MEQKQYASYRWVILILSALCFLFSFITRLAWSPVITEASADLGISAAQAGGYMSAFYIGYIITQIPAGLLADKFGSRVILSVSLLLEAVATILLSNITSYSMGFALRVITGLGAGAIMACCGRCIGQWFPPHERGKAFGIVLACPSLAIVLNNYVIPMLVSAFGTWRNAFLFIGIATLVVAVLSFILIKGEKTVGSGTVQNPFKGLGKVISNKNIIILALAGFCLMWSELSIATWANSYMKETLGMAPAVAGYVMMFYGIGGIIAPIASGSLADRIGHRREIMMVALLLGAVCTILFGLQRNFGALAVVGFLTGFTSYLCNPHLSTAAITCAGDELSATATGLTNFVFQLASTIGPLIIGIMVDMIGNFGAAWYVMAAGPVLGAIVLIFLKLNDSKKAAS